MENQNEAKEKVTTRPIDPTKLESKLELSVRRKHQNSGLPGDDAVLQNPKIGSSFRGKAPLSGLTIDEEKKYLPEIIGISPIDVNWRKEVRDYWNNISERVAHDKEGTNSRLPGRVISFTVRFKKLKDKEMFDGFSKFEDKARFAERGEIVEGVADYVLFKYCLVYSAVANSKEDVNKSAKILFYLYSQENQAKKDYTAFERRERARSLFSTIRADEDKVDSLLRVFKEDPTDAFIFSNIQDKHLRLDTLISKNPGRFINFVNDKSLEQKALISEAVVSGIIHNPANTESYFYGDDKQVVLGNTLEDAVLFLRSKQERNIQILESIKAQLL